MTQVYLKRRKSIPDTTVAPLVSDIETQQPKPAAKPKNVITV